MAIVNSRFFPTTAIVCIYFFLSAASAFEKIPARAIRSDLHRSVSHEADGADLSKFDSQKRAEENERIFFNLALTAGAWLPTENLARLGKHPSLGFDFLMGFDRYSLGLRLDWRFLDAAQSYKFYDPNNRQLEETTKFAGLFLGADFRWEFVRWEKISALGLAGYGYDMIHHKKGTASAPRMRDAYINEVASDAWSLSVGLGLRIYLDESKVTHVDLETRYHSLDYSLSGAGADDLSGDYFTVLALIGVKLSW